MASTNLNTDSMILSSDIYDVSAFLDQIRADNIPDLDETSSMIGIFGYMNEMFSQSLQNTLIVTAETSNEAIPTRAKFTKNVINHAMNLGITNIYAQPSVITLMIYLPLNYLSSNFVKQNDITGQADFILDRNIPINIGGYEFHLDYDVIIHRMKNPQGNYVYTAKYDLFEKDTNIIRQANPISDITNPYITTLIQTTLGSEEYLSFSARLHQVELLNETQSILTNNPIENKSITFSFNDQLAAFDIDITEKGKTTHLIPVYQGLLDNTLEDGKWCYYEYLNANTIRVIFSRDSYVPGLNAEVKVNIQQSSGSSGNFTYTESFRTSLNSEKYNNYNGMYAIIYPLMNGVANCGKDSKSISDLRKIIPREASSRGAIINTTDLQNFFNSIDDDKCKLYFKKKRDNQFERMYYSYILMRKDGNVYPTNTLSLKINQDKFIGFSGNNNLVIKPGTVFYYYNHGSDTDNDFATVVKPKTLTIEEMIENGYDPDIYNYEMVKNVDGDIVRLFEYISPYLISIDDDLITAYLMTLMDENKTFKFASINQESDLQFISTNMNWKRKYIKDSVESGEELFYDNKYTMTLDVLQNNSLDYKLVSYHYDENNNFVLDKSKVRVIMVLYSDETATHPYRYAEAKLIAYDDSEKLYTFEFTFGTDDFMDINNRINITGLYNAKPEAFQINNDSIDHYHGYMNNNTYAKLFILADFGFEPGELDLSNNKVIEDTPIVYGNNGFRNELESYIPLKSDIIKDFLSGELYEKENISGEWVTKNVIWYIKNSENNSLIWEEDIRNYNNGSFNDADILRYIRDTNDKTFINTLLSEAEEFINRYQCEDFSRYTMCNSMTIDGGIDFYHDYTPLMRSDVTVSQIQKTSSNGNPIYSVRNINDGLGHTYQAYTPIYEKDENNKYKYDYTIKRIPMIRNGFLNTEEMIQDYIYILEERRKYILECLYKLEDTFDIDFKFFNTYGPSRMFYYNIPSSQNYKVKIAVKETMVYITNSDTDNNIIGKIPFGTILNVNKVKGQYARVVLNNSLVKNDISYNIGWIKLADTIKMINYIDNVSLIFDYALEAKASADKYISDYIINDIKEYIEDINQINELHIPNIITLITNNYREQLVYFEFLNVNQYGPTCQHLYLDEKIEADICPEFLNVLTNENTLSPEINITVY
jgi:hypothetical protein